MVVNNNMDDLGEIQRRVEQLEAGLAEVKALIQRAAVQQSGAPASPPFATPPPPAPAPPRNPWTAPPAPPRRAEPAASTPAAPTSGHPARPRMKIPEFLPPPKAQAERAPFPAAPPRPPASSGPPAARPHRQTGEFEANLVGSWFARIGAFAIFLGAAFAFKYAVDRNLISPAGRVAVGILVGVAFVGWAEWARRKAWPLFAQAVAGGGVAILYLSVWAGYQLYDLMSPGVALILLALVVAAGGALSLRHDSVALAIIASLGGYLNPLLVQTGRGSLPALYLYLLFLDAGILALAFRKTWRNLSVLSMVATWLLVLATQFDATGSEIAAVVGFSTLFLLMFHAALLGRYRSLELPMKQDDLALTSLNSLLFTAAGLLVLDDPGRPVFTLVAGLFHIGLGIAWRSKRRTDTSAVLTFVGLGIGGVTLAVALQFEGPVLATIWAVEAVAIMMAATRTELSRLRYASFAIFALSVGWSILGNAAGYDYRSPRPFLSTQALPFVTQIASLAGAAVLLRRKAESPPEARAADAAAVLSNLLAVLWLTFELWAQYQRADWGLRTFPYVMAGLWALYAAGVGAFGVARSSGWTRPVAAAFFAVSLGASLLGSGLGVSYEPAGPLLSVESAPFLLQIAILSAAAVLVRRSESPIDKRLAEGAAVGGNTLAVLWLSLEIWAHYNRPGVDWTFAFFTFALSTAWTLYGAGLLAFGIGARAKWARLMAVLLLALVIGKLVLADVWLLETPLRIAAFVGLGFVLLGCSMGYHRFRALILGPDEPTGTEPPRARAA
ncbi:MAG TPA: DUF2339 domain-containing protein [Actinomycetota bacterium]|nr:DUF2339 domain-containing protein [Actinomycetota bacterium]